MPQLDDMTQTSQALVLPVDEDVLHENILRVHDSYTDSQSARCTTLLGTVVFELTHGPHLRLHKAQILEHRVGRLPESKGKRIRVCP
jgi:hypothetical protein